MRKTLNLLVAVSAIALAAPAFAAPTITSAAVTGPTGTVWDTDNTNSFYTLFLSRPLGTVLNPTDNFSGAALTGSVNGRYDFSLNGDGFPVNTPSPPRGAPQTVANSDPFYTLTLRLTEGAVSQTLTGVYTPSTFLFAPTSPGAVFADGVYTLDSFTWARTLSNTVGAYSSTNTAYNASTSPGSGLDYLGAFTVSDSAVPEPATWALMIAGFGLVGASLRLRRKPTVAFA